MRDDDQLIERTLTGDMQAFRWLIKKHERLVSKVVGRIIQDEGEMEEVCQDVFMRVYHKLDSFRGDSKFSTWLVSIAYRMSLNHLKKKKGYQHGLDEIMELRDPQLDPSDMLEASDEKIMLEKAIAKLPVTYRSVITLFHLEEMTYEEVAEIMSMPLGTVKNYLFRGRKQLKEMLERSFKREMP